MKKIMSMLLVLALCVSLCACGSESTTNTDTKKEAVQPTTSIEQTEEPFETVEVITEAVEETEIEVSFNESFINTFVPMGVPVIMEEYKKLEEAGQYDVLKKLMFRKQQKDENIPVLEEQTVSGDALVIATSSFSDEGTTTAELYLGTYNFDYKNGIIPAKEKLLSEHPEEWCKFVSIVSGSYMQIKPGDLVTFEGTIYGIQNNVMSIRGTCNKK